MGKTIIELLSKFDSAVTTTICLIVLIIIFWFVGMLIKNRKNIEGILNYWFEHKNKEVAMRTAITDVQAKMKQYEDNRIHDREQSFKIQEQLTDAIAKLNEKLDAMQKDQLNEKIENMRWKILDFANSVMNGKHCFKDQFDNVLKIYDQYEKILEENDMSNGQVEESMKFIKEKYHELISGKLG